MDYFKLSNNFQLDITCYLPHYLSKYLASIIIIIIFFFFNSAVFDPRTSWAASQSADRYAMPLPQYYYRSPSIITFILHI